MASQKNPLFVVVAVVLAASTVACNGMRRPGFPKQSFHEQEDIKDLETRFNFSDKIEEYYSQAEVDGNRRKNLRNQILVQRLAIIDLWYASFVGELTANRQLLDVGSDLASTGLSLAATAAGAEGAKTVLAAIATGLGATKLSIDKNFFYEKTVPVLVDAMSAARKSVLAPILRGMDMDATAYPLERALADVHAYYFAGTFPGALQAIQADTGAKEKKAEDAIEQIRSATHLEAARQDRVAALLRAVDGISDSATLTRLASSPPVAGPGLEQVQRMDSGGRRRTDAAVAKRMLKVLLARSERSDSDLDAWEAAIKANQ